MGCVNATGLEILIKADDSVVVTLTATDCTDFSVGVANLTVAKAAVSLGAANWSATFSGAEITGDLPRFKTRRCGGSDKVFAQCNQPGCGPETYNTPVICEGCPPVTIVIDDVGPCVQGHLSVAFHAEVAGGPAGTYEWDHGDGTTSSSAFIPAANAVGIRTLPGGHSYDAISGNTVVLRVTLSYPDTELVCKTDLPLKLDSCPPPPCPPVIVTFQVRDSRGRPPDARDDCLAPGFYTVEVIEPTDTDVRYRWSVDGVLDQDPARDPQDPQYPLTLTAGDTTTLAVVAIQGDCDYPGGIALIGCDGGSQPPDEPPDEPPDGPDQPPVTTEEPMSPGCAALLVSAIVLLLVGGVLIVLGVCVEYPPLWIVGIIVAALGLVLFLLWVILCSALTPCSLMQTMHCILFWIVAFVAPVLVLVALLFGGLPCGGAAAAAWGGWGALFAWLGFVMARVGCVRTC